MEITENIMKKFILCGAMFLSMMAIVPVSQAAVAWANVPWKLYDTSCVKGGFFGPYYKACHWRKTAYDPTDGTYQAKLETTYTSKFGACPAPLGA